jgi:CheY-like chemotaxis protein
MLNQDYNILLIEDDATTNRNTKQWLEYQGYRVISCFDIYEANANWKEHKKKIRCIVTDLNIVANGLSDANRDESRGGLFTGWLWLWEKVFSDQSLKILPLKKVIILTAYQNSLTNYISDLKNTAQKNAYKNNTIVIPKGDPDDAQQKLLSTLQRLEV